MILWPPRGYTALVRRNPSLSMAGVASAEVPEPAWDELHEVNSRVNLSARYEPDPPGKDTWGQFRLVNGLRAGDCDDFAVRKLKQLMYLGWPRGAVRLATCLVDGTGHCVLRVATKGGSMVLDNRHAGIAPPHHRLYSDYAWIGEELPGSPFWWRKISQ
jgi:predicted transglutaminase-like cysteine proteinase